MRRLLPLLLLALLAPAPAHAVTVGLAEQTAASFADDRLRALGLRHARLVAPWDAALTEPARVQAWLDAVAAAGARRRPGGPSRRLDRCPGSPCLVPSAAQFRAAVAAFVARWPQVRTYTAWNEANHESQPVAGRPEHAAVLWGELVAACPGCTVVAGDVLDSGSYVRWLERFQAAAPGAPRLWGLHNYGDVTYGRTTGTDAVLAAVDGEVWIEETGGIVTLRDAAGRVTLATDEARAARAIDAAFAIAATRPRVTRLSFYHWRAGAADRFDAGLTRPDGTLRPSFYALAAQLGAQGPAAPAPAVGADPAPRWRARWSRGRLVLRGTCRAPDRVCRGRVRVALQTTRAGRTTAAVLASRTVRTAGARPRQTIVVRVPARLRARARAAATRRLRLTTTLTRPAARAVRTVAVGRPPG